MEVEQTNRLTLTANAISQIETLLKDSEDEKLRIFVSGGGCSGFQYGFSFENEEGDLDKVMDFGSVSIVVDEESLKLLENSEVDYVKSIAGESFSIKNPNAASSCGCGKSFTPSDKGAGCANTDF